jgi:translation elongation factor EF-4
MDAGLTVIPIINKIDLPSADPEGVKNKSMNFWGWKAPICP